MLGGEINMLMAEFSSDEPIRIYGPVSLEEKQKAREELLRRFKEQEHLAFPEEMRDALKRADIGKTPEISKFINCVNEELLRFASESGLTIGSIPESHIHILSDETIGKTICQYYNYPLSFFSACYIDEEDGLYVRQSVFESQAGNTERFLSLQIVSHEMVHSAGYHSFSVDRANVIKGHRGGFRIDPQASKKIKGTRFNDINEALTEEINLRIIRRLFQRKDLALTTALSAAPGPESPDFDEWFDNTYVRNYGGYPLERKLLNYIINEIYQQQSGKFTSPEGVFKIFVKGYFGSGFLKPVSLMRQCFGMKGLRYIENSGAVMAGSRHIKGPTLSFEIMKKLQTIRMIRSLKRKVGLLPKTDRPS